MRRRAAASATRTLHRVVRRVQRDFGTRTVTIIGARWVTATSQPRRSFPHGAEPTQDAKMDLVAWARFPSGPGDRGLDLVAEILDPVLVPLGFAPGQIGVAGDHAQVIFCRGDADGADDGCTDLVVEVEATPDWQIVDVRYWGFPSERWHLGFDRGVSLASQLRALAKSLPAELA